MTLPVILDPGHGGNARSGNSTPDGMRFGDGRLEKQVNFALAQRVSQHLGGVRLTRNENENRAIAERVQTARDGRAGAFVSLHTNTGANGGSAVWVHPRASTQSLQLAEKIRAQLQPIYGSVQLARGELAVLSPQHHDRETAACLVDLAFGGSADLEPAAGAIARGVRGHLGGAVAAVPRRKYPLTAGLEGGADPARIECDPQRSFFEVVEDNSGAVPPPTPPSAAAAYDRGLEGAVGEIVNAGKTLWDVMKDNRPVSNSTSDFANAIPQGATLTDVSGWEPTPRTVLLHYHTESYVGLSTDIYLTISWYFNGAYRGTGQYINAATVIAAGDVAFGQTVNITASINSPMNLGTQELPIGALPVRIRLTQSNVFQNRTVAWDGLLEGNGAARIAPVVESLPVDSGDGRAATTG
jgi:hypothetical protein